MLQNGQRVIMISREKRFVAVHGMIVQNVVHRLLDLVIQSGKEFSMSVSESQSKNKLKNYDDAINSR